MTSIFQAGQPFNLVRTSNATYQASDKDLVISSGDEVALPSPDQGATVLVRPAPSIDSVNITTSNGTIGNTGGTFGIYGATEPIYLVGDGTNWYARSGGSEINAIPDSVVSREPDDDSNTASNEIGIQIESTVTWPSIDGRISSNVVGATRAYIYRFSDGVLIGDADISLLSAGDVFTVDAQLSANVKYNFVLDAEGASYTFGRGSNPSLPRTSSDGDLTIVAGAVGPSTTNNNPFNIVQVGSI